ncbi:MAG: Trm112 family protein [Chloroflexi bacterium]|nr:Trm112 family protein [Chloroflexota bacterium]
MVSQELLDILRCPNCAQESQGLLEYYKESWFICSECDRKYPIRDDIPVMLIDEGDKWIQTKKNDLAVPPPSE